MKMEKKDESPVKAYKQSLIPCYFGAHRYEIIEEDDVSNISGAKVGKTIISRCKICGKIRTDYVKLINTY